MRADQGKRGGFLVRKPLNFARLTLVLRFAFVAVHTSTACRRHIDETRALTLLELTSQTGR